MGLLTGKNGLIFGVADRHSIAWGIAQATAGAGARLAFTYQIERFQKNLAELTKDLDNPLLLQCDVNDDAQITEVYRRVGEEFGTLDFVVHSVAHARREDLAGRFRDTSRDGFNFALEVSAYSLIAVARPAVALMPNGGSIVTMTYLGSERAMLGYNVMGVAKAALEANVRYLAADLGPENIRVNAISAGPINTLAARGVPGFTDFARHLREKSPLALKTDTSQLGDTALFLVSELGRGVTGEVIYCDAGYHMMGA
jgi:enoyl-[acyl-carrier protein] reductase I